LAGSNAQGKTTILEAVAYLANFSSFYAASDRQLLNFNLQPEPVLVGRIVGEYQTRLKTHSLEVRFIQEYNGNPNAPRFRRKCCWTVSKNAGRSLRPIQRGQLSAADGADIEGSPSDRRQIFWMKRFRRGSRATPEPQR
jgi:DNA replication and repair protein RecF